MLGLPETVYQSYDVNGFIRTWLEDNGINTAILADFRAANKLEELVRHHAILIGDEFFLPGQAGKTATVCYSIALLLSPQLPTHISTPIRLNHYAKTYINPLPP